jgi:hypothetical protein
MMVVLLLLLGFIAVAAGMFGLGLGVPVKETTFGAAVLVSSSVALTGGFILLGLAAAVSELRRALQAGMRQMRVQERFEAERSYAARRTEPRLGVPGAHGGPLGGSAGGSLNGSFGADAADVIPARFDAPEVVERPRPPVREDRPLPDAGTVRGPVPPPFQPAPGASGEPRRAPAAPASERL